MRDTLPENPFRLVIVMFDEPDEPAWRPRLLGLAERVKFAGVVTTTVTLAVCERDPLVPLTVTIYEPFVEELSARVDEAVAPRETLVGLRVATRPCEGEMFAVS